MDNQINNQNQTGNNKVSKAIVVVFVLVILAIFGFILSWFSFSTFTALIISLFVSLAFIYLIYYLQKRAIKNKMGGLKMAKFSLYAFSILIVIDLIGSLVLSVYSKKLNAFAVAITPTFFENNFSVLKENSTERLKRIISYEKEIGDLKEELADIGKVNECFKEEEDYTFVSFGPDINKEEFDIGLMGAYSMRCYGEEKSFDIMSEVEYKDGKWLIDSYNIKTDIGKEIFEKKDKDDDK